MASIDGCRWWTKAAQASRTAPRQLRHEHVVPRRVIIESLLALDSATYDIVRERLERWCIAAVVSKEEDQRLCAAGLNHRMPIDWDGTDVWARYRVAGIQAIDTTDAVGA